MTPHSTVCIRIGGCWGARGIRGGEGGGGRDNIYKVFTRTQSSSERTRDSPCDRVLVVVLYAERESERGREGKKRPHRRSLYPRYIYIALATRALLRSRGWSGAWPRLCEAVVAGVVAARGSQCWRRCSGPVLLLELAPQPFGRCVLVASGGLVPVATGRASSLGRLPVAAAVLRFTDDALDLLLSALRRCHLRGVLLAPLGPTVLEPHLECDKQKGCLYNMENSVDVCVIIIHVRRKESIGRGRKKGRKELQSHARATGKEREKESFHFHPAVNFYEGPLLFNPFSSS